MRDPAATSIRSKADDLATVAAIAVIAACISTIAHEAIGHGGACLATGGRITQLTSVYFQCEPRGPWIAAAGPAGNLAAAALAGIGAFRLGRTRPALRLLLVLVMAFSLFWSVGYLLYTAAVQEGDWAAVARSLFGELGAVQRVGAAVAGVAFYIASQRLVVAGMRGFQDGDVRAPRLLRFSWMSAAVAACIAAVFYQPDRAAVRQAALEIGAASAPLLLIRSRPAAAGRQEPMIQRDIRWWLGAAVLFAGFVLTLGRGLP